MLTESTLLTYTKMTRILCHLHHTVQIFEMIGAMASVLLLVSRDGVLYEWEWSKPISDIKPFTRQSHFKLDNEKIAKLACSDLRCTLLTESGRLCSFMDRRFNDLDQFAQAKGILLAQRVDFRLDSLEFSCTNFPTFAADPIESISVSNIITTVQTASGRYAMRMTNMILLFAAISCWF